MVSLPFCVFRFRLVAASCRTYTYSCGGFTNPKPSFVFICQLLYFVFNTIQCGDCHRVVKAKHRVSFLRQHFLVHRPGKLSPSFLSSSFIIVGAFGNFSCLIQCLLPCSFAVRHLSSRCRVRDFSCKLNRYGKANPARNQHSGLPHPGLWLLNRGG